MSALGAKLDAIAAADRVVAEVEHHTIIALRLYLARLDAGEDAESMMAVLRMNMARVDAASAAQWSAIGMLGGPS
jgi:hypothetical protein